MSSPEAENAEASESAPIDEAPMDSPQANQAEAPAEGAEVTIESLAAVADEAHAPEHTPAPSPANDPALLRRALEGLLFITDRPLSAGELCKLVNVRDQDRIVAAVEELRRELEDRNLGYRLIAVAEGWQMATRPELAPYMRKLFSDRATMRLSTAAQETLSIISYKQPLTRAEVEEIRGVEVIAALETLLEKRLIKVVGRRETVGRPLMYGTTMEFLRHFGLRSLEDLPPLDRFSPAETAAGEKPFDTPHAEERPAPAAEAIGEQTEEAVIAEALSEHPAEDSEPAAEEPVSAESVADQTEEAVIAEVLSEHPADSPEANPKPEEEEKEGLWPK
ncbi:MAG: SMC-Scp complex subunit ScpB [Elusimicrobia bacterium]|nr:SMC-Scp complex subunit ScpB [Elusimicrobiota bacterium]